MELDYNCCRQFGLGHGMANLYRLGGHFWYLNFFFKYKWVTHLLTLIEECKWDKKYRATVETAREGKKRWWSYCGRSKKNIFINRKIGVKQISEKVLTGNSNLSVGHSMTCRSVVLHPWFKFCLLHHRIKYRKYVFPLNSKVWWPHLS